MFNFKGDRLYSTYSKEEYLELFKDCKKNKEFNTLGFYRSILENDNLSTEEKIEIRDLFNTVLFKRYEFLQLKDPDCYINLELLGKSYTNEDRNHINSVTIKNQQKILQQKRIKHRNFGYYSKHPYTVLGSSFDGVMAKKGSYLSEVNMYFESDMRYGKFTYKFKSKLNKKERKHKKLLKEELKNLDY